MAAVDEIRLPNREDMDDDSYEVVLQLMLEDSQQLAEGKGKQKEGTRTDTQVAFDLYAQEIQNALTTDLDHRLTLSVHQAMRSDANAITQIQHEELMARHDRQVALAVSRGRVPPAMPLPLPLPPPAPAPAPAPAPEQVPETASAPATDDRESLGSEQSGIHPTKPEDRPEPGDVVYDRQPSKGKEPETAPLRHTKHKSTEDFGSHDEADDDLVLGSKPAKAGESSSWVASRQPQPTQRLCLFCTEPLPELRLIRAPCSHECCHDCIKMLFNSALRDETLFPPRCCQQVIPVEKHSEILGQDIVKLYHAKQIELSTKDRTYCYNTECGTFIKPGDVGHCPSCDLHTCTSCNKAAHSGDCPQDSELHRVLEMAEQKGWRRCAKCNAMVELSLGCNHMTCRCGYQFCYGCGVQWKNPKTCPCPQWDEEHILPRRDQPQPQPQHQVVRERGARTRQQVIEENLNRRVRCTHEGDWQKLREEDNDNLLCEDCLQRMPYFLFQCSRCRLRVCRRCREDREAWGDPHGLGRQVGGEYIW